MNSVAWNSLEIDGVYIIHPKTGYEVHEQRIRKIFAAMGMPFHFVTEGSPSEFTEELLGRYFVPNIHAILTPGVLSCTLNHILAYERMLQNGDQYALIFENDPFFLGDFLKDMQSVLKEARQKEPGFIVSLENTTQHYPSFWDTKKGQHLYQAYVGRCAGAYLIDRVGAEAILADLKQKKCDHIIDWWHNGLFQRNVLSIYWAHPTLVEQGSHNGELSSTISTQNKGWRRKTLWWLQNRYKKYFRRFFPQNRLMPF